MIKTNINNLNRFKLVKKEIIKSLTKPFSQSQGVIGSIHFSECGRRDGYKIILELNEEGQYFPNILNKEGEILNVSDLYMETVLLVKGTITKKYVGLIQEKQDYTNDYIKVNYYFEGNSIQEIEDLINSQRILNNL